MPRKPVAMAFARVNGIDICYEISGGASGLPLLLIAGLDMQLTGWPDECCDRLVAAGNLLIRYDNRDIGLSTHLADRGQPDLIGLLGGLEVGVPYTLADMADDAAGLLGHLGIESAHVVGISMGGMIAQALAIYHPDRVRSLCSIMSNTGNRAVGQPSVEAVAALLQLPPNGREEVIEFGLGIWRVIGSPAYPSDPEVERERIGKAYDRSHDPDGVARQAAAIITAEDRTDALKGVRVPTLVIHGDSDPLVDVSGGIATARAIPDAQLLVIEGMGHDLPVQLYDRIVDAILAHVAAAETLAGNAK